MELLMKNIHMCRRAKQVEKQVVLEEDLNVPDAKPDVEMIIQSREHVVVEHTRAETGKLYADGYMEVGILYQDDTAEHRLHRLETRLPFEETIVMEDLESGEDVRLHYETEDLNVSLINSRKLAIRAIVRYDASVDEIYDIPCSGRSADRASGMSEKEEAGADNLSRSEKGYPSSEGGDPASV